MIYVREHYSPVRKVCQDYSAFTWFVTRERNDYRDSVVIESTTTRRTYGWDALKRKWGEVYIVRFITEPDPEPE